MWPVVGAGSSGPPTPGVLCVGGSAWQVPRWPGAAPAGSTLAVSRRFLPADPKSSSNPGLGFVSPSPTGDGEWELPLAHPSRTSVLLPFQLCPSDPSSGEAAALPLPRGPRWARWAPLLPEPHLSKCTVAKGHLPVVTSFLTGIT